MLEEYLYISGYAFLFYGIPLSILLVVLIGLQSWTLSRRLDKYLFNEEYFMPQEMAMFSSFPLSMLKTLAYIRLITFPNSLRKRFGNATARNKISGLDLFLSYLTMAVLAISVMLLLNLFIAGIVNYIRLEF